MSQEKMRMKKLRELIRLSNESKIKNRDLAKILNVSASTISYYLRAIKIAAITWPLDPSLSDSKLLELVEPHCAQIKKSRKFKDEPCWDTIHKEMSHKHMTIQLVYEEYIAQHPSMNFSYSSFCRKYKSWRKKQKVTMQTVYEYGEKSFIDYAGDTIPIYSRNGKIAFHAQIFIQVLAASQLTFVTATLTQTIPDWIEANVKALEFFGGVPAILIPDNLRSAIKDSCKYDPVVNPAYSEFAAHYGTVILPARPYKPKDKALAENAVLITERWIMARLRAHKFYTMQALINKLLELNLALNNKPFQRKNGSRTSLFIEHKLKPLPQHRFEIAIFNEVKVQPDYHIYVNKHFYSVPYQLIGSKVEARITSNTIEVFHDGQRVASHFIKKTKGGHTTLDVHMPPNHREHKNWTEDKFLQWTKEIGEGTYNLSMRIINNNQHKDQSYRFHLGLKQLEKKYSAFRLNAACLLALNIGSLSYKSISSILRKQLDMQPYVKLHECADSVPVVHDNIRGKDYFKKQIKETK